VAHVLSAGQSERWLHAPGSMAQLASSIIRKIAIRIS
jgi:hypothetical protein